MSRRITRVIYSRSDDTGLGVVELIVYSALAAIVMLAVTSIFAAALGNQVATTGRDHATGSAQVVTNSIQTSIRNAACSPAAIANGSCTGGFSVDGNLLRARVANGGAWECRAWEILTRDGHSILAYKTSTDPIPATGGRDGWALLATDVSGTLDGSGAAFSDAGDVLVIGLAVGADAAASPVSGRVVALAKEDPTNPKEPSTCW